MTQLTINIENKSILPHLKKILAAIDGVSIAPTRNKKASTQGGLRQALQEVKEGKTARFESVEDLFNDLGI